MPVNGWRPVIRNLAVLMVLGSGIFPLLGLVAGGTRVGDLLNHFQLQYFTGGVLGLIALAVLSSVRLCGMALVLLVCPTWRLAPYYLRPKDTAPAQAGSPLRVVAFNVLSSNTRYADAVTWVGATAPDVVFFAEVDPLWAHALLELGGSYPYHLEMPDGQGNFGVALYSKYPLKDAEIRRLGNLGIPMVKAVIVTPQHEMTFFGAHPLPPMGGKYTGERDRYLQTIADEAGQESRPVVVAGDLNATPWSRSMQPLFSAGLLDSGIGRAQGGTWRRHSLVSIPIDHILYRSGIHCGSRWIGPDLGSDHRPVVADLFFEAGGK